MAQNNSKASTAYIFQYDQLSSFLQNSQIFNRTSKFSFHPP